MATKTQARQGDERDTGNREAARSDDGRSTDLRDSPMMAHLMDALEAGTDIGHYGRLTFAMVALVTLMATLVWAARPPL